ncbi:hypothetical protein ANCDUO_03684 [Ancylostoma duodenale]|uniref:Uncharacterized protein n=1 Tax=Ancylostoma duodenale TaxID=51022 RepID=A0A0C2GWU1_9BILA|nr:hypothetical protein ANCDUO_03684 [Ancylostoma duodenale]
MLSTSSGPRTQQFVLEEQAKRGFSIMNEKQKQLIYGEGSPYNSSATLQRLRHVNTNNSDTLIENEIRLIAEMKEWKMRQKDIVTTPLFASPLLIANPPILSQPVILSPLVFSPSILTPAVLGPVVLGPWVRISH